MAHWVDLTHDLVAGMPVFPGDPAVSIQPAATVAMNGYEVHSLHVGTHSGTHVDAPSHSVPGGRTIDQVDPGELVGDAIVLHVEGRSPGESICLEDAQSQLARGLEGAEIVLLSTGWDQYWGTDAYFDHPVLAPDLAERLIDIGARVIGVDTLNPDSTCDSESGLPVHEAVLGSGCLIIENLRGLTALPSRVRFVGLPLRLRGLDGSPIRACATW